MPSRYEGRPWRARFLRSPKIALTVSRLTDFVALDALATISLGLKTGADKFFYVLTDAQETRQCVRFGASGSLVEVPVCGLDGWKGHIAARDLLPAIRNPHELFKGNERVFFVPSTTRALYLYPRDRAPSADLGDYIKVAEREGIHEGELVRSNASAKRWYRQTRAMIQPSWILPYNSAYDYGAWDNQVGAIINGRFVGVEPKEGVDSSLLGAVLNSTLVMATRLLEGVTTGVEGAFDVGPPAARLMAVPDVRRMSGEAVGRLRELVDELRKVDRMPPAPNRDSHVEPVRHELDLAVLSALGWPKGDAAALTSRLYESYARWRRAVEDVESRMRQNRSTMARLGQNRSSSPIESIARTLWSEMAAEFRLFPHDLLDQEQELEEVDVSRNFVLASQEPLFDAGKAPSSDGREIDLGSWSRIRYASMLLKLGFEPPLLVPKDPSLAGRIADTFELETSKFETVVSEKVSKQAPNQEVGPIAKALRRLWYRASRSVGMSSGKLES